MTIHEILDRLHKVRKLGNRWTACCPAHEDSNPSLSVGVGEDGRFLICCQAGCRTADVMEALGLGLRDLFPDDRSLRKTAGTARRDVATAGSQQPPRSSAARAGGGSPSPTPKPPIDWVTICADIQDDLVGTELGTLHLQLDVSESSLARLECGWSDTENAYTFPMRNGLGEIIGVSLRGRSGAKWAIPGSKLGLFIPYNLTTEGPLFMPEGASDTAAMLDLGLNAVGRSQALIRGERLEQVRVLMDTPLLKGRQLVVVADNDPKHDVGWTGAYELAMAMARHVPSVKVLEPHGCKDVREWVRRGIRSGAMLTILKNVSPVG